MVVCPQAAVRTQNNPGNRCPKRVLVMQKHTPEFVRFRDIDKGSLNVEFQIHTNQTDGAASIEDILQASRAKSLQAIAFTEHVRRETQWFDTFAHQVRSAAQAFPDLQVYIGCEAKALDEQGTLDASQAILDACDIVLGVVHRFPDGNGGYLNFNELEPTAFAERECALMLGLLKHAPIDVLGHPGGMYQRRHGVYPRHLFQSVLEASLERGIAIEINSSYLVDPDSFLQLCQDINPFVSIGSDVHRLEDIAECRDTLLARGIGQSRRW